MAYTQADLDNLRRAIAKGARRLRIDGEEVEFRSLAEMERLERKLMVDLGQASTGRLIYPQSTSGWR